MNKITAFPIVIFLSAVINCRHHNGRTSLTVSESEHTYSMAADFPYDRTGDVEQYMDEQLGKESNMSFMNTKIDGPLSLDDHTTFYLKKSPGYIEVKLDRDDNTHAAYNRVKTVCEGIKKVIGAQ